MANDWRVGQAPEKFEIDKDNSCFIGSDGCHYNTKVATLHFSKLNLCGCGSPEEAYNFCRKVLIAFDRRDKTKEWSYAEKEVEKLIVGNPDVAAHVLAHVLNHYHLLEHGSSVGGSWTTDAGNQIIDLGEAKEEDFNNS